MPTARPTREPATPLRIEDVAGALDRLGARQASGLVVAVSGGPDSICLMRLIAQLRALGQLPPVTVATVDHGLRAGSDADAAFVVAAASAVGLPSRMLAWTGPKPTRAVQEQARTARYALLTDLCRSLEAAQLLTAHTLDDQAETVLFRLARGSGPAGLAGMSPSRLRDGIVHVRPLLGIPKARLLATCEANGWAFVTDPANRNPRFARTRLRQVLPLLEAEGLDAARLCTLATRTARSEAVLRLAAQRVRAETAQDTATGRIRFDACRLAHQPAELVVRVLGAAVEDLGQPRPIRLEALERLAEGFLDAVSRQVPFRRSLHGTLLSLTRDGWLEIEPEGIRRRGSLTTAKSPVHHA